MLRYRTVHGWLLYFSFVVCATLLLKAAFDLSTSLRALALPFWLLVLSSLAAFLANLVVPGAPGVPTKYERRLRWGLLAVIPLGFLASSLDCSGFSATGCTPFCTFIRLVWIPALAVACVIYLVTRRSPVLLAITLMSLVPLAPHCVCDNAANAWWIKRLGASPECYAWGFAVTSLSVTSLRNGARFWPTFLICAAIIGGALSFFLGHHYFRFPW